MHNLLKTSISRIASVLVAVAILSTSGNQAWSQDTKPLDSNTNAQVQNTFPQSVIGQSFVKAGGGSVDDWRFVMGPSNNPYMKLRLVKSLKDGAVAFECSRDTGEVEMVIAIQGVQAKQSTDLPIIVSVGTTTQEVLFKAMPKPDGVGSSAGTPLSVSGLVASDILASLGAIKEDSTAGLKLSYQDNSIFFIPTFPRDIGAISARVCSKWLLDKYGPQSPQITELPNSSVIAPK